MHLSSIKKSILIALGGAALGALGFVAGRHTGPGEALPPGSLLEPGMRAQSEANSGPGAPTASDDTKVRAFVPGRPFPEGGARDWILTLTPAMKGDKRGKAIAMVNHLQVIFTLDENSVREVLDALQELTAEADAQNPERRNNPNGDGVLDALTEYALIRLAQTNPKAAMESLRQNFNLNDGTARFLVMGTIATHDPARAEELALSMGKDQQKDSLRSVLYALVNQDPLAALAFADRHHDSMGDHREDIYEGWVRRDPQAAMTAAVQSMAQSGNAEILRNTIEEWAKYDPAAAAHWAESHEGSGSVVARAMVLEKKARDDPQGALQEFAALQGAGGTPEELARLTSTLAASLAAKDVPAARSWAESLSAGDLQDRALSQMAKEWVKQDAPASSEWILSLPAGSVRDSAAQALVSTISRRDPTGAFEWARSINSEPMRRSALQEVLQHWREIDPDAADSALASLPPEARPPQ